MKRVARSAILTAVWLTLVGGIWLTGPSDPSTRQQAAPWMLGIAIVGALAYALIGWHGKEGQDP
jgi:glycerol uptake facilitator-like aquaporin